MADSVNLAEILRSPGTIAKCVRPGYAEQARSAPQPSRGAAANGNTRSKPFPDSTLRLESAIRYRPTGERPRLTIGSPL